MNQILQPGQTAQVKMMNTTCKVGTFLGGGGQGEVYQAELDGKQFALKWYFPQAATDHQRTAIETLVEKGAPDNRFLWPLALVEMPNVRGFGYVMPLRDEHYKSIVDLMLRRVSPSFRALARAGYELADGFLQLHARGYSYRDISFGNVFFDPDSGAILICDNDNVAVDGQAESGVFGTPRFMAPEIVRGDAAPNTQTDLFSLAVLLFYMLFVHHPLEGKKELSIRCMDFPAMRQLYGTDPVYIFDPNNPSNQPVKGYHDNALVFHDIYPRSLLKLFEKAFTLGLHDAQTRVRESEWRQALTQLQDSIFYCAHCSAENFYDVEALRANGSAGHCWSCQANLSLPFRLRLNRHVVMLNHDTELFPHHVDSGRLYDFSQPVARVKQHPQNPNQWGLENLSTVEWTTTGTDGSVTEIGPGRSVSLTVGRKIQFGSVQGEIHF